jgi:hypothetical protein
MDSMDEGLMRVDNIGPVLLNEFKKLDGSRLKGRACAEAGHPDHRGELAATQGKSGARQLDASGPPGQEDGPQKDPYARSGDSLLQEEYLPNHHQRFSREPAEPQD